jgi:hypothetical protein
MIYLTKTPRRILEIRSAAGETRNVTCPVCELGVDIAARAVVTHDLYPVCGMRVDITAVATEPFEIRLHSKIEHWSDIYIYIYIYIYVKNLCNQYILVFINVNKIK